MKNKIIRITIVTVLVGAIFAFNKFDAINFLSPSTVEAVGDLVVDFGVPPGQPIFNFPNMSPGDINIKNIIVTNNALEARPIGIKGIQTVQTGAISNAIYIVISKGPTDLYGGTSGTGPKTLAQFFTDSNTVNGIALSTILPNQDATYTIKTTFNILAGNELQSKSVTFDIKIGITIELPAQCNTITFSGNPIFGTQKNDILNGTSGNDLIIGFEGNDIISGNGGDDCIIGNSGNDIINAGNGNDKAFGNEGNDILNGEAGNDTLIGGTGNDIANGGVGNDTCVATLRPLCEL